MARPLRIVFSEALSHFTSRDNVQGEYLQEEEDRGVFLELLSCSYRHEWWFHAYCLMGNHYHLLLETTQPT